MLTLPPQVHTALDRLAAAGWEAYVVGGAVRDALRGSPAGDWDFCFSGSALRPWPVQSA